MRPFLFFVLLLASLPVWAEEEITSGKDDLSAINVLLIDGQGTHNWRETTPVLKRTLEETGLFDVKVVTAPAEWENAEDFQLDLTDVDVVLLNYFGKKWSAETCAALLRFIGNGGGLVLYHSANTAFPDWPEFQDLLGITGWGGRNSKFGPYRYWNDELQGAIQVNQSGPTGTIGEKEEYVIEVNAPNHPIMKDLSLKMLHGPDELYGNLRGKKENAPNVMVLASAFSSPELGGTGHKEPVLAAILYGTGRVFQILYGHSSGNIRSVAFIVPFLRGTQWAATGKVTIPVPEDIPTEEKSYTRP
ncbi:MAG: ThuA domain-containing protein [Thermoguttaceae bacterium]|nr:ThuA domain-containing protein [Thermoguttaceae bacterium]